MPRWTRHPTKATAHYPNGQLAASVHPNQTCASEFEIEVFDHAGKRVDRRGAKDIDDGIGMATAVLAGVADAARLKVVRTAYSEGQTDALIDGANETEAREAGLDCAVITADGLGLLDAGLTYTAALDIVRNLVQT